MEIRNATTWCILVGVQANIIEYRAHVAKYLNSKYYINSK